MYGALKSAEDNFFQLLLFLVGLCNMMVASFVIDSAASAVFTKSEGFISRWKGQVALNKIRRRRAKGLFPAKVRVGDDFLDGLSPCLL
jgi:hypothetical protein